MSPHYKPFFEGRTESERVARYVESAVQMVIVAEKKHAQMSANRSRSTKQQAVRCQQQLALA